MKYIIYQITNNIDGKIYIGKHKTKDLNDDYMGSGILITRAIKKYGLDNFTKKILFQFDNQNDMDIKEKELVDEDFVLAEDSYNLTLGGKGGWDPVKARTAFTGKIHTKAAKKKISDAVKARPPMPQETRDKISNRQTGIPKPGVSKKLKGSKKTAEHKRKISESLKGNRNRLKN